MTVHYRLIRLVEESKTCRLSECSFVDATLKGATNKDCASCSTANFLCLERASEHFEVSPPCAKVWLKSLPALRFLILILLILLSPPGNRTNLNWHELAIVRTATMHIHGRSLRFVEQIRRICLEVIAVLTTRTRRSRSASIPLLLAGFVRLSWPYQRSQFYAPGVPLAVQVREMPSKAGITSRGFLSDLSHHSKVAPFWLRLPTPKQ